MPIRTYSLNSREAYEALRRDPDDLWGPSRCGEPRMPEGGEGVGPSFHAVPPEQNTCPERVEVIDEDERQQAREWLWHLENGRIGGS